LEKASQWTGTLESLVADDLTNRKARHIHKLRTASGVKTLRFSGRGPNCKSGQSVLSNFYRLAKQMLKGV